MTAVRVLHVVLCLLEGSALLTSCLSQPTVGDDTLLVDELRERVAEGLPAALPEGLPFNDTQLPTEEEAEEILRQKCERVGGEGAYERAQRAKDEMRACAESLVNVTELQAEMEQAKPTGDLDMVFRKYCQKSPQLMGCVSNFTAALEPCMEERERESKRIVQNISEALLRFICYKEGDRIALFIAEKGPECLMSKEKAIEGCINTTVGRLMPARLTLDTLPLFVLEERECNSLWGLRVCVVTALEECSEPTPANIVESMFNYIMRMTPCAATLKEDGRNAGDLTSAAPALAAPAQLAAIVTLLLYGRV